MHRDRDTYPVGEEKPAARLVVLKPGAELNRVELLPKYRREDKRCGWVGGEVRRGGEAKGGGEED